MSIGVIGKKEGMTRLFSDEGVSVPVTVVSVFPNSITQVKSEEIDGYNAIQVTFGTKKEKNLTKSELGHFNKSKVNPGEGLWEFQVEPENVESLSLGSQIGLDQFEVGQKLDVSGTSKGKGFAGTVKRWNFQMQDATHGNSLSHRAPGSIGQCQTPGRVWKGKKMSGHMGFEKKTIQNLEVVGIYPETNTVLIKGSIPGANGTHVILRPSVK
ncbi:MAG: 50S ribosomal protein L3 [SAR86 cluster bacterium]|jgi:large subunit ribosomal protein L3|nr:50S ribosomal protein L3 [SAR86 cluster bacterium]